MKNKMYLSGLGLILLLLPVLSNAQTWKSVKSMSTARDGAISFSIGNYGFCGGGSEGQDDFWRYNATTNTWTQMANIPGVGEGRGFAVGVSVGKYGYIGFGQDSGSQAAVKRDWWRYDTATNTWTQKASLPGTRRNCSGAFVINGKVYVFGGFDSANYCLNDCWAYDTGTDSWTPQATLPDLVAFPSSFSINGKGYFTCYVNSFLAPEKTITYMYDPVANTWTTVASFPGAARQAATAFVLNNIAYVGLGQNQYSSMYRNFYSYNPVANTWSLTGNYGGSVRAWSSAFIINNIAYVGTGSYFSGNSIVLTTDWWKFTPSGLSVDAINDMNEFACYPVPAKDFITVENTVSAGNNGNDNYYIYDINGQLLDAGRLAYMNGKGNINVSELPNGEYVVCLKKDNTLFGAKKITVLR